MFENFSNILERSFRTFFIFWVCFWTFINGSQSILFLASFNFSVENNDNALFNWWFVTLAALIGLTLGVVLLFFMSSCAAQIKKSKAIKGIGFWLTLSVLYYVIPTVLNLTGNVLFNNSNDSVLQVLVFNSVWIFPSIVLLVIHVLYFKNLDTYNSDLKGQTVKN